MRIIIPIIPGGLSDYPPFLCKPSLRIAGKSLLYRMVERLVKLSDEPVSEIAFVVGFCNAETTERLKKLANAFGSSCKIYRYEAAENLTVARLLQSANPSLEGGALIAFANNYLFELEEEFDRAEEAIVWVKATENNKEEEMVKINESRLITQFYHKNENHILEEALSGIFYFKHSETLRKSILCDKGAGNFVDALKKIKETGVIFMANKVKYSFDMNSKAGIFAGLRHYLNKLPASALISDSAKVTHSVVAAPSYIGENVCLENVVIGPYTCIETGTTIKNAVIQESLIGKNCHIESANLAGSLAADGTVLKENPMKLSW